MDLLLGFFFTHDFEELVSGEERCIGLLKLLDSPEQLEIVFSGLFDGSCALLFFVLQPLNPVLVLIVQCLHLAELACEIGCFFVLRVELLF